MGLLSVKKNSSIEMIQQTSAVSVKEIIMMTPICKMLKGGSSVLFANCGFTKLVQECMENKRTILYVPIAHKHQL